MKSKKVKVQISNLPPVPEVTLHSHFSGSLGVKLGPGPGMGNHN